MKKVMLAVFVLALSFGMFAQDTTSKTKTKKAKTDSSMSAKAPKSSTLTGCVGGSSGAFTVKKGTKQVPVTSSDDLSAHVGHKVKLTGTWEGTGKAKSFNATKTDMVSDSCMGKAKTATTTAKKSKKS
jgi:hypothetical protein